MYVNSFNSFVLGLVVNVLFNDLDVDDKLICKIIWDSEGLFRFILGSCILGINKRYDGSVELDIMVNGFDGRFVVEYNVKVCFVVYNLLIINNSVMVWVMNLFLEIFFV